MESQARGALFSVLAGREKDVAGQSRAKAFFPQILYISIKAWCRKKHVRNETGACSASVPWRRRNNFSANRKTSASLNPLPTSTSLPHKAAL